MIHELSTVGTVRRKSKRDRNRTQTVMTTTENATSVAKNGYPAMPTAAVTTPQLRVGKTPTMSAAAAAGSADVVEDVNMSSAAAAIVIVRHHHKRSEFLIVAFT